MELNGAWWLVYFFVFDVSFGLALLLTPICKRLSAQYGYVDQPDLERKTHTQAMPLLGGVAVFAAFAGNILFQYLVMLPLGARLDLPGVDFCAVQVHIEGALTVWPKIVVLLVGGALMVALGLYDDKHDLRAGKKLLGQILIASMVAAAGMRVTLFMPSEVLSFGLTILWIVTITNAMNFLDNMDGLCAGVGLVCALLFALVAGMQDQYFVCLLALVLAGALLGFLPHNFKPATIFLGDAGSHFVGYVLAVLPVVGTFYQEGTARYLPILVPLFVLAVPLFDLGVVMWIRLRRGEPVYIGDRNHISHRLVRLGLPESWAVTLIYLLTATLGLGAAVLLWTDSTGAILIIVQALCVLAVVTLLEQLGGQR
jgi:UDP-GlcNAc:undecaprenyl-phosphate GlcNAc-1-phosphate transferase